MEAFKRVCIVAHTNWRQWKKDYRVWIILTFVALILITGIRGYVAYGMAEGRKMTFCLLPMFFESTSISLGSSKILIYIGFLLLISSAPFIHEHTPYVILRSGRKDWWRGECLYIAETAVAYMLFLMIISILCTLPVVSFSDDWGDILYDYHTGSNVYTSQEILEKYPVEIGIPGRVVAMLYPFFSQFYVFITGTVSFIILGLLTYLFNLRRGRIRWGIIAAGILIILDPVLSMLAAPVRYWLRYLSPVCWSSVDCTRYIAKRYMMGLDVVIPVSLFVIGILILLIAQVSRKVDLYGETGDGQ